MYTPYLNNTLPLPQVITSKFSGPGFSENTGKHMKKRKLRDNVPTIFIMYYGRSLFIYRQC